MKQLKQLFILLIILLFLPITSADLDFFESTSIVEGETVKHNIVMIFSVRPESLEYPIFIPTENIEIRANFERYKCKEEVKSWGTNIVCDFSEATGGNTIGISFQSEGGITFLDEYSIFEWGIRVPDETKKVVIRAELGEGLFLIEEDDETSSITPFHPSDGKKGSDGRRIYVVWDRENLNRGDSINVGLAFEGIAESTTTNYTYFLLPIPLLIILFIVFLRFERGLKSIIPVLKEDERAVIEILQKYV